MPRFVSQKDFNFFQHINRELVSDVVDVDVILYKIALETTAVNLYGEATEKARYTGVELKSLVRYPKNISNAKDGFGVDVEQNVEFRFVRALLEQVKTYPEAGDIIYYDEAYYEIDNVNDTQLVAGQPQYTTSILCNAHLTRRSGVQIEEANT
jgi:uncharacterized protein YneR